MRSQKSATDPEPKPYEFSSPIQEPV